MTAPARLAARRRWSAGIRYKIRRRAWPAGACRWALRIRGTARTSPVRSRCGPGPGSPEQARRFARGCASTAMTWLISDQRLFVFLAATRVSSLRTGSMATSPSARISARSPSVASSNVLVRMPSRLPWMPQKPEKCSSKRGSGILVARLASWRAGCSRGHSVGVSTAAGECSPVFPRGWASTSRAQGLSSIAPNACAAKRRASGYGLTSRRATCGAAEVTLCSASTMAAATCSCGRPRASVASRALPSRSP